MSNNSNEQLSTVTDLIMNRLAAHRELIEELKKSVAKLESQVAMLDIFGASDDDVHDNLTWREGELPEDDYTMTSGERYVALDEIYQPGEEDNSED